MGRLRLGKQGIDGLVSEKTERLVQSSVDRRQLRVDGAAFQAAKGQAVSAGRSGGVWRGHSSAVLHR